MLKEKSLYKEGLPVNAVVAEIQEYPIHFHEDIELVYVLSGSVELKDGYYTETLKKGDIFIINSREMHSIKTLDEKNMIMMLQVDSEYFSRYYENLRGSFFAAGADSNPESLGVLKGTMSRIMLEILQKGYGYEHKVIESTHNLISCLLSDFRCAQADDGNADYEGKVKGSKVLAGRLNRITDYMYANYSRKLTLNEIADREHLSIYYLSHVIKEATGLSFQDLLSFIRVEESEKLLLGTNKKIGVIAYETGFSAVRYYIKHFETWFGMSPLEYRRQYAGKVINHGSAAKYRRCTPTEIEDALRSQSYGVYAGYMSQRDSKPVIIEVDLKEAANGGCTDKMDVKFFQSEKAKLLAGPYQIFKELEERLIYSDANCAVSTGAKNPADIDNLTILIYNINDKLKESFYAADTQEELRMAVRSWDEEAEMLIRCTGLNGEYTINRYQMSRENFAGVYEEYARSYENRKKRDVLLNKWRTMPRVSTSEMLVAETLNIRTTMKGVCAEIIMVDRKPR